MDCLLPRFRSDADYHPRYIARDKSYIVLLKLATYQYHEPKIKKHQKANLIGNFLQFFSEWHNQALKGVAMIYKNSID